MDDVVENLTGEVGRAGGRSRAGRARHRVQGRLRRSEPLLLRARACRWPADRAADAREDRSSSCAAPTASPDEVLGMLLPDRRAATVWSIAVNGVMAGCRPEYMPMLSRWSKRWRSLLRRRAQRQHAGRRHADHPERPDHQGRSASTTRRACMRDGFLPNTSVGRFWRLYLRNVAGLPAAQERQGDVRQHLARRASRRTKTC